MGDIFGWMALDNCFRGFFLTLPCIYRCVLKIYRWDVFGGREEWHFFSLSFFRPLGVYPCWECTVLRYCTFLGYNIMAQLARLLPDYYYFLSFDHCTMVSYYLDMGLFIPIDQRVFLSFSKTGDFFIYIMASC